MNGNTISLCAISALFMAGCGGGSSTPASEDMVLTGVFIDSPVEGVTYATATQLGLTNAAGEFSYLAGEQVTFSIGATQLPAVAAAAQITPVDIAASSATSAAMTTNIARLLQSLDQDGNPDNGITISADAAVSAASINFDVGIDDFANNAAVINLVANSGSSTTALISADAANAHLNDTLGITAETNEEEVILDLRDSVWIVNHNPESCSTSGTQTILRYSQTRFFGENTSYDGNCETSSWSWDNSFSEAEAGSGFLFLCGGDAQCSYQEINRSVSLEADDPRNGCNDANGEPRPITRRISHEPGSDYFEYTHCSNDDGYRGRYVRQ